MKKTLKKLIEKNFNSLSVKEKSELKSLENYFLLIYYNDGTISKIVNQTVNFPKEIDNISKIIFESQDYKRYCNINVEYSDIREFLNLIFTVNNLRL